MSKTILEPAVEIPVYDECDVLVVGGGSAGHAAALAAARAGCEKVIIMERYDFFGGDVTGGYVLMIPALNWRNFPMVRGIQEEWFTRLDKSAPTSYISPTLEEIGSKSVNKNKMWSMVHGCTAVDTDGQSYLVRAPYYDPNEVKLEMDAMIQEEPRIRVLFQSWGTKPIVDAGEIKGVIFESKEGRQAVLAKVVIDATGDGDIFSQCAPFFSAPSKERCGMTALVWRMGGIDFEGFARWRLDHPEEAASFQKDLNEVAGYPTMLFPTDKNDVVWFNNWLAKKDCANIDDIRDSELLVRNSIRRIIKYCQRNMPQFLKGAYLYDIAPQLGARCSKRLDGEYVMTPLDAATNKKFDDVIAWHSCVPMITDGAPIEIPYSALLPKGIENLLAAGRHISADEKAINGVSLIPQCVGTGQAAGVAAAVICKDGSTTHTVDIKKVQKILCEEQNVPLPRQENTDPELVRQLEEDHYGVDTAGAKRIRAAAGLDW